MFTKFVWQVGCMTTNSLSDFGDDLDHIVNTRSLRELLPVLHVGNAEASYVALTTVCSLQVFLF